MDKKQLSQLRIVNCILTHVQNKRQKPKSVSNSNPFPKTKILKQEKIKQKALARKKHLKI